MDIRLESLNRFLYSHYFLLGLRRSIGMLTPMLILGLLLGDFSAGIAATFGALGTAIIDQPGPHRHRRNEMLTCCALSTLVVAITGLSSTFPALLWLAVVAQCFVFSMFSVYGKKGNLISMGCLLLMSVTMHAPLTPAQIPAAMLYTAGGGLFYTAFSLGISYLLALRETRQSLSVALFATADYIAARSAFYDVNRDLEQCYSTLIRRQSAMIEQHQDARDIVLRSLPGEDRRTSERSMLWNIFSDMIAILDTMLATHTDYILLRRNLRDADIMLFARDCLEKLARDLERIALAVSQGRPAMERTSVKAELRAIDYEMEQLRQQGLPQRDAELYGVLLQVQRRLRGAARLVERLYAHTRSARSAKPEGSLRINKSLSHFLSRQDFRLSMLTSNLRLDSPHCRYAIRVACAAAMAMTLSYSVEVLRPYGYWIVLTIVAIMKPGFALTRQRNSLRLIGTLLGCIIALICSYILPWWEQRYMAPMARASLKANREYLRTGLAYVDASRTAAADPSDEHDTELEQARLDWMLARKNLHTALANMAEAFYRMTREPRSRQVLVPEVNNLVIQNHILASQMASIIGALAELPATPPAIQQALDQFFGLLDPNRPAADITLAPSAADTDADTANLTFPMRQLLKAGLLARRELAALESQAEEDMPPTPSTRSPG
ncbi:putative membrane protein YccC [Kerstersia gyiorum]|uniref:FUSC family protein n=1 Tax=Kerstersia gyiorum TaxID=206506 RepID=UPI0020A175F2|nr:FUSC family protein [Kerstersia gyiorum]MCP1712558.1 putative membrane protein YccC [Kerstersia gyiorum]